ncbi:histidine--tRNA ligase [Frigoribacterium endophyticum]|uniref:histidine--tRNA ligase n=1 Tax=Frigoribacterium endophyticum TaxID=1522176 RepID=UPI00141FEBB9|nr:ATP phosphoribosyltransferase regulatory subunit [Frigoribacterium endophyticum]NII51477.1 histidyl-tRNA synthetase [Frigoribacterium endophyticum]
MPSHVTPPRGMRDFLPAEKRRRERVLATVRDVYRSRGFDEIETPVVEGAEFLWSGLGGDNEKQVFAVLRRGLDLDAVRAVGSPLELADLGLRFDLTVPLARFYASHRAELPTVFRSVQIAPVWRAERPQKGRYRQFVQCDIDILGEPGQQAEVELISATTDVLDALGLRGTTIRVNDRRVLLGVLAHWGVAPELTDRALIEIDKLDKIGVEGVATQLRELGVGGDDLAAQLHQLGEATFDSITGSAPPAWLDAEAAADLVALRDALPGATLVLDPTLVRGMGYYTGTIFEVAHPDFSYSLGGGGRYDGMIGRFLGTDVPAAGFSLGFERIVDLVELDGADDDGLAVLHDKTVPPAELVALQRALLAGGEGRVRLERRAKNARGQLAALAAAGFGRFTSVRGGESVDELQIRPIG